MRGGTLAVVVVIACVACVLARGRLRVPRSSLPAGVSIKAEYRSVSEDDYRDAEAALREFATEYRLTFQHGRCSKDAVMALHSLRQRALQHMYALRMRLPNDLEAVTDLTRHIEDTDALLRGYISNVQQRCGEALLLPGPIDDAFYRQFYRAHNDTID